MQLVLGDSQKMMGRENKFLLFLIGIVLIGAVAAFPLSYLSTSNGLLGICLLPYAVFIGGSSRFNFYYFFGVILFGVLASRFHVKIFYFLSLAFYLIFLLELFFGKVNSLVFFFTCASLTHFPASHYHLGLSYSFAIEPMGRRFIKNDWHEYSSAREYDATRWI
jgi:hypothetical protein